MLTNNSRWGPYVTSGVVITGALCHDPGGHLGSIAETQLHHDALEMAFRSALGDDQCGGDVLVAQSLCDEVGDLSFAAGQRGDGARGL